MATDLFTKNGLREILEILRKFSKDVKKVGMTKVIELEINQKMRFRKQETVKEREGWNGGKDENKKFDKRYGKINMK